MLLLLCLLLRTGYIVSGSTIETAEGQSVTLPCRYAANSKGLTSTCWGLGECPTSGCARLFLETDGKNVTFSQNNRYQLKGDIQGGDVSLTIAGTRPSDNGIYCCRVKIRGWFNDQKDILTLKVYPDPQRQITTSHTSDRLTTVQSPEGAHPTEVTVSIIPVSGQSTSGLSDHQHRLHIQSTNNNTLRHHGVSVEEPQISTNTTAYVLVPVLLLTLTALAAGFYIRRQKMKKDLEHHSPLPMTVLDPGGLVSALERSAHAEDNVYVME